jgi:hypothetical protein
MSIPNINMCRERWLAGRRAERRSTDQASAGSDGL